MAKKALKQNKEKAVKGRYWAFIAYPESLPENWQEILTISGLKIAVSPLHDADLNADETEKKAHYHIILAWENPTTFNNVAEFSKKLNATIPVKLNQVRGYYRYLTHKDNPEKAQYDENDIKTFNDFYIGDFCELSKSEVLKLKKEARQIIKERNIYQYDDLLEAIDEMGRDDLFDVVASNVFFFVNVLGSRRVRYYEEETRLRETDLSDENDNFDVPEIKELCNDLMALYKKQERNNTNEITTK